MFSCKPLFYNASDLARRSAKRYEIDMESSHPTPRLTVATERFWPSHPGVPVDWVRIDGELPYPAALALMESRVTAIADGTAAEAVFLVEHPPIYTAGTSANVGDLLDPTRFPVFATGRGGEYTYHGPGQRVAYVLLDLKRRRQDVRAFVAALEHWIIATLADHQVRGERREDRVGVWVRRPDRPPLPDGTMAEDKIAAIGIRVRRWVSFHGISLNVDPDLSNFGGIVPCGIAGYGVTSLVDLGLPVTIGDVDLVLRQRFADVFGPIAAESSLSAETMHD